MNWTIIVTLLFVLLFVRIFWAHVKANNARGQAYKNLAPKDKLAVLKECLLNDPTETNLSNLGDFLKESGSDQEVQSYKPLLEKQLTLANQKAGLEAWDELYVEQSKWIDQIRPLEFDEAENALKEGDKKAYIEHSLEGISRLYSDRAIEEALKHLEPDYPKAETLLLSYRQLVNACEESRADEKSLEALRKKRNAWIENLLTIEP
ncbi:MAG: hypothetical protein II819_07410 [Fibrobacter sp.]|nr:hypothetical protein [Fibrobacter sp.]